MSVRFTPAALRHLVVIGGLLLGAAARAQSPTVDPSFTPVLMGTNIAAGGIYDVVRQPDGKYLVGGSFQSLNGQPVSHLARLLPDGSIDATFAANGAANGPVSAIVLQPDGKILVAGSFQTLGGSTRVAVGRLRADGTPDPTFAPTFSTTAGMTNGIGNMALQPDGKVLITGEFSLNGTSVQRMARLDGTTGQVDAGFQYTLPTPDTQPGRIVLQPDGKILVAGMVPAYRQAAMLMRLQANGAADTSFPAVMNPYTSGVYTLALDGAGRIYAGGMYNSQPDGAQSLRRYLPNGTVDRSFTYAGVGSFLINSVAIQPNGRLLVGSNIIDRVLDNGAPDATFQPAAGPSGNHYSAFNKLLIEPDGKILVAGNFALPGVSGQLGLARLGAANVLAVKPGAAAPERLAAWPVPARETLHLRATAPAQSIELLDALGRTVRHYAQPATELSIPLEGLRAGAYQLRVAFTDGRQATRRVMVQ